jgi:RNA polymerase sigma-70 factor (ECF subfamily)
MSEASHPELVARAQRGDPQALGALYDDHHQALFRYFWSKVGSRELAEDLTADVFMRMLTALPRYHDTGAPFRAWLYGIARHRLVDHYRKQGQRDFVGLEHAEIVDESGPNDPLMLTEHRLSMEHLQQALTRLSEPQREVVTLRFLSGLSLHEVAQVVNKSEQAVKALQHRGLAALRLALARE